MTRIICRAAVERYLNKISRDIAKANPPRAKTYRDELVQACVKLTEFPLQCEEVPEYGSNVRRQVHGNYLIFYR